MKIKLKSNQKLTLLIIFLNLLIFVPIFLTKRNPSLNSYFDEIGNAIMFLLKTWLVVSVYIVSYRAISEIILKRKDKDDSILWITFGYLGCVIIGFFLLIEFESPYYFMIALGMSFSAGIISRLFNTPLLNL